MAETTHTIWLSQEAFDKLTDELTHLTTVGRTEISERIAAAREEGDLSENGGYHAAREEQGKQESRIRQLEDMLRRAEVGEAPAGSDVVIPGVKVTVAFDGDEDDTDTFVLGSRELLGLDSDLDESTNVYSPQSPLGSAVLDHKVGDVVEYATPTGAKLSVTIIKVEAFEG
ncbi:transcription elongation factor GreA [Granulicoccus phenolivorans]|uniref:transcription elongation factor GreA n=1 Tax=Granulicoccus phenolivorans TaxID=266854 RepID=UPI000417BA8B|nr:transcription elongation factor GreA [Granulicoccus phenolivorans]